MGLDLEREVDMISRPMPPPIMTASAQDDEGPVNSNVKRYTVPPTPPPKTPRTMEGLRRQGSLRSETSEKTNIVDGANAKETEENKEKETESTEKENIGEDPILPEPVVPAAVSVPATLAIPLRAFPPRSPTPTAALSLLPPAYQAFRSHPVWEPPSGARPARPVSLIRPMTSSTKRLSFSTISSGTKKTLKHSSRGVELVPQPSDELGDPLNWLPWRKWLALAVLLLIQCLTSASKTLLLPLTSPLAMSFDVSYTAAVALTGVPILVSAATIFVACSAARAWGKRPVLLASTGLMFVGAVWASVVAAKRAGFAQLMAARIFQGLGWGAIEALVGESLRDLFFEHELPPVAAVHQLLTLFSTWLPPLVSGLILQSSQTIFGRSYEVLAGLVGFAWVLVTLSLPETTFDRSAAIAGVLPSPRSQRYKTSQPLEPRRRFASLPSKEMLADYMREMKPVGYCDNDISLRALLQPLRAVASPTSILVSLATFIPSSTLWGLAASLSLLFAPMPFMMSPAKVGLLLASPLAFSMLSAAALAVPNAWFDLLGWTQREPGRGNSLIFSQKTNIGLIAAGSVLVFAGSLGFGLYAAGCMTSPGSSYVDGGESMATTTTMFALDYVGSRLSFPVLSLLLGLIAAGSVTLDATAAPLARLSSSFTSNTLAKARRAEADMAVAALATRALLTGAFVLAVPNAVWFWEGLRTASVGLAVAQIFAAGAAGALWWGWDESIRRLDGRVMGLVNLDELKRTGSFFDTD